MSQAKKMTIPPLTGGLLLILCFVTYPMALFIPTRMGVSYRYDLILPTLFIATIFCIINLLSGQVRGAVTAGIKRHPIVTICGFIYITGLITAWWLAGSTLPQIITFLSLFVIPAYCFISPRPFKQHFDIAMGLLWFAHTIHGLQQLTVHSEMLGLTGNRNWAAAIIAATAPWAWRTVCQTRRKNRLWRLLCGALIGGVTLLLMYHAASRAAWLMLAVYACFKCVTVQTCVWRRIIITGLAALICLTVFWIKKDAVIHRLADDVRGPIWLSTSRMIADHPLAGVSPGAFRRELIPYRTDWQMKSSKAAAITVHPHNEWLHIAAVGGIPAALVWAAAAAALFIFRPRDPRHATVHYSAFILVGCGMLDLTLFMPPTALPGLIFLGLHLRYLTLDDQEKSTRAAGRGRIFRLILTLILFLFASHYTWNRIRFGWHIRKSNLAMERHEFITARDESVQAYLIFPYEAMQLYQAVRITIATLNDPLTGVRLGELLMKLEPDIAHINWMLGVAYEKLDEDQKAIPFYKRESELYPFTVRVQSEALDRFIKIKDFEISRIIRERLAQARFRHLCNKIGRPQTEKLIAEFLHAVSQNDTLQATKTANQILEIMPYETWCSPVGRSLANIGTYPILNEKRKFVGTEMGFWEKMIIPSPFQLAGSQTLTTAFEAFMRAHSKPAATEWAAVFHLGGWHTAIVTPTDKHWPEMVDIRHGDMKALVLLFPTSGDAPQLIPDIGIEDLFNSKEAIDRLPAGSPDTVIVTVPVHVPDFLTRNQILGDILRRGEATGGPPIGVSPELSILRYQDLMRKAAGDGRFTLKPSIQE